MQKQERAYWLAGVLALPVVVISLSVVRSTLVGGTPITLPENKKLVASVDVMNPWALVGSPTCSARSCHGAIEPERDENDLRKCWQNEYTQWADDPHANAYRVLFEKCSQDIAKLLGLKNAHEAPRCLACHAAPMLAELPKDDPLVVTEKQFGVGCESCHGSASKWLHEHTSKIWRDKSVDEKWEQYRMVPVGDPVRRARACAGCHVGAPPAKDGLEPRDVNHDLIGAGHPRLTFEMGAFQANMHPHWRPQDKRSPDEKKKAIPESRLWTAGQFASAEAALEHLIYRANDNKLPWPELAEFDCYACHHFLREPSWRQTADLRGRSRKPGQAAWGSWYFALPRYLSEKKDAEHKALAKFAASIQLGTKRETAAREAAKALTTLRKLAKDFEKANAFNRIQAVIKAEKGEIAESWDSAEQLYLALHALKPTPELSRIAPYRAFKANFATPNSYPKAGEPSNSPRDFFEKMKELVK